MRAFPVVVVALLVGGMTQACGGEVTLPERPRDHERPRPEHRPASRPGAACASVGWEAGAPAYVTAEGFEAQVVYGDGSRRTFEAGEAEVPPEAENLRLQAHLDDRYVATVLSWMILDNPVVFGSVLSLFDADGELRFRLVDGEHEISIAAIDEELSIYRYAIGSGSHAFVSPDGDLVDLPSFRPVGFPDPEGWVAGYQNDTLPGWLHIETAAFEPLAPLGEATFVRPYGQGFLSLEAGTAGLWLVQHRRDGAQVTPLEGLDAPAAELSLADWRPPWLLLSHQDRLFRAHLDGAVAEVTGLPPPALGNYCDPPPRLASDGALLVGMALENAAVVAHFDLVTAVPVGRPLSQIETFVGHEVAGTLAVSGQVGTFCPLLDWPTPPEAALLGASTQIVRDDAWWILPGTQQAYLHPSGMCALYVANDGAHLLDVIDGSDTLVGRGGFAWR